jgi:beta-lactamase regulating signal transducer with metallopeptidase domain
MTWLDVLGASAWKGTIVLAAAFLAVAALRRASAAVRHFVWVAALAALLALPVALRISTGSVGGRFRAAIARERSAATFPAGHGHLSEMPRAASPTPRSASAKSIPRISSDWWIVIWLVGVAAAAAWFGFGRAKVRSIVRTAVPADCGTGLPVPVLVSADAAVPMACGLWRPRVILPASSRDWPAARLRIALAHEYSHIQRGDLYAQLLAQIVCCLYWFQPLAWLAARRLRQERERACDDAVLAGGVEAHEYAAELMELARTAIRAPLGSLAMAESSGLEGRVRALLDRHRNRGRLGRWQGLAIMCAFAAILLPIAAIQAQPPAGPALLTGIVSDATGAVVPGGEVTARGLDGPQDNQLTTRTDAVGIYRFPLLPPGRYALQFSVPGFAAVKREATLTPGQTTEINIRLTVGSVLESIVVKGKRPASLVASARPPQRIRVGGNVQAAKLIV